jgi:cob(I)alamin adenosyltransferase
MKIYTRTGDDGETGLLGGRRVSKSHQVIEVCGSLDETNSWIGLVRCEPLDDRIEELLTRIQSRLFDLGSRVAACLTESSRAADFPAACVEDLESAIDHWDSTLKPLEAFILPSGSEAGSRLHMARSVCRRTERQLVSLMEMLDSKELKLEMMYLNRLSDLLFVLARSVNQTAGNQETNWTANRLKGSD